MRTHLTYHLDFSDFHHHFVNITLHLTAPTDKINLYLPTWIAGSYLIREFAKNIDAVFYTHHNQQRRACKIAKNIWQIDNKQHEEITIHYRVYCYDLSVRTAYIDHTRLFGNFSALLLMPTNIANDCTIHLCVPNDFLANTQSTLAIGLPFETIKHHHTTIYRLNKLPNRQALNTFDSYDFPFEIAKQTMFDFAVHNSNNKVMHRFFITKAPSFDHERLKNDLQKICQSYANYLEWMPFDHYTFMTYASLNDYGGLEHINSTALITPRDDLPQINEPTIPSKNYQRFLGLCSHEYFHAWWVKSVRPDVMMNHDLQQEAYTPLLWVFEGFTSYIDDLMLYLSGVIDKASYLALLADQITRYHNNTGRRIQTLAESSFDSWIKLYRPDENSQNSTVSYYNKGALVALGLDLLLMQYNARLLDVVKSFTDKAKLAPNKRLAMTCQNLDETIQQWIPSPIWQHFKDHYVYDTTELPLDKWLSYANIDLQQEQIQLPYGLTVEETNLGLTIKNSHPDSQNHGLSAKDIIIAINGQKANLSHLQALANNHQTATVHAFRRDLLMQFVLTPTRILLVKKTHLSSNGIGWPDLTSHSLPAQSTQ